jgi:hypothetical protein
MRAALKAFCIVLGEMGRVDFDKASRSRTAEGKIRIGLR